MHKESILAGLAVGIVMVSSGGAVEAFDYTTPPLLTAYDDGSYEGGNSIKTDSLDNIYAAVLSQSGNGKIIKYSADNQLQWVKEFDPFNPRPADLSPYVTSTGLSTVAIDNSNNVYAVGESFNGVSLDCLLKKYTPEGELLWERRYNELLPNVTSVNHFCNDLTIDAAGNVVAAGTTQPFNGSAVVNWTNRIIKWDSNGNLLGTFGIENGDACGPAYPCMFQIKRVAADAAGNIVTIERHQGLMSDRVAKYDQFMQLQSATPMIDYSGTISSDFYLRCKDLDSDIIAYDPTVIDQCNDMALNMFAGSTTIPQASTLLEGASTKINSNLYSLAVDPSGSIFAVGFEGDYNSLLVLNSDLSTSCQDKRMYAPPGNGHDLNDFYHGVVTAPNGNAFVVGSESRDFLAMEYNAQCQPQWVDAVGGVAPLRWRTQYRDFGTAITLDSQNNLVVFGQALKFMPDYTFGSDAVISKFVRAVATSNPDLSLEAVTAPTDGQALQNIAISGSIANNGTGATGGNFRVTAYISADAAITDQDTAICNAILPAQEAATTQPFSCNGALPINLPSGAYYIGVLADDGNVVSESDETNNTWSAPFQFTALPDLTVTALTVPAGSNEGSPVTISGAVANPGIGSTNGPVRLSAYLSNGTPLCTADVGPMVAGETKDFTCTATTPSLASGTYTVIAHVNQDNTVTETATHNNTASAPIVITALPDLVVTSVVAPSFAKKSSKITFTSTIANQGSAASDYFFVRGYVSTDSQVTPLDSFVCSNASGAIAPGASAQFTCTGTLSGTLTRGSYWVGVYVDPTYRVTEINENNNSMAKPFIIE